MRTYNLIIFSFFLFSLGCEKEKPCSPSCGPLQSCNDGVCSCRSDQFLLGNSCVSKCENCYEGAFECGCTDKYVMDFSFKGGGNLITLNYVIPGTSGFTNGYPDVTKLSETKFRFLIPRSCDVGNRISTHIEFVVDKSDPSSVIVEARHHILPSNETLATCSTIFKK
ncbi:MAG: hypothetical protein KBF35_07930 [Saprospiraceae bacterium]|nr:hypothetical protein [Saprospiraceae bacterium]